MDEKKEKFQTESANLLAKLSTNLKDIIENLKIRVLFELNILFYFT